jgi:hypothetical protein
MQNLVAGPPFVTDDPQPVPYKHWEYYISSINTLQPAIWTGTLPHFEVNYGMVPNMQIHLLLPLNYSYFPQQRTKFGYADTELGVKYCFVQETERRPQIGTFPIAEIPTAKNSEFSDGKIRIFIPVWAQKSWDKLITYGGIGYSINPGTNNRNSFFAGWEFQYDFITQLKAGAELYFQTADTDDAKSVTAFNIGGSINAGTVTHFIFSIGHSLMNEEFTSIYIGILWTI